MISLIKSIRGLPARRRIDSRPREIQEKDCVQTTVLFVQYYLPNTFFEWFPTKSVSQHTKTKGNGEQIQELKNNFYFWVNIFVAMSKLSEYSKFDHLDDGSSGEEEEEASSKPSVKSPVTTPQTAAAGPSMRKNQQNGRYVYEYDGKPIYEWEQSLEEVILYIPNAPPAKELFCNILPHRLQLGKTLFVQSQGKFFIDEDTFGTVEVSESTWTVEDGTLVIYLAKANKAEVWEKALKGKEGSSAAAVLDPFAKQEVQKEMMLERFQAENPGMDFRGAEFNGSVPDPRTFMGGVKYR